MPDESSEWIYILSLVTNPTMVALLPLKKAPQIREGVHDVTKFVKDFIDEHKLEMIKHAGKLALH